MNAWLLPNRASRLREVRATGVDGRRKAARPCPCGPELALVTHSASRSCIRSANKLSQPRLTTCTGEHARPQTRLICSAALADTLQHVKVPASHSCLAMLQPGVLCVPYVVNSAELLGSSDQRTKGHCLSCNHSKEPVTGSAHRLAVLSSYLILIATKVHVVKLRLTSS